MTSTKPRGNKPLKFKTVADLEQKIEAYFASCWDYKRDMFGNRLVDKTDPNHTTENPSYLMIQSKPYTITGLAVFLDTTRETLLEYEGEVEGREKDPGYADTIKKAKAAIYAFAEESLYSGKQAAGPIFNLKNNWGWKDKHEFEGTIFEKPIMGGSGLNGLHRDDSDEEAQEDEQTD